MNEYEHETYYRVRENDTLQKIAEKFHTTVSQIIYDNIVAYPTISENFVCAGWVLKVS